MNEDKMKSLLDIIDHMEQFSDAEMERVLRDKETLAFYETIVMVRQALQSKEVRGKNLLLHQGFFWKAASVIIILFVVGALGYAAFHFIGGQRREEPTITSTSVSNSYSEEGLADKEMEKAPMAKIVLFENKTLREVLDNVSEAYKVKVKYEKVEIADLRLYFNWDTSVDIHEVLNILNSFDHFHLELEGNTIVVSK
jgi:hypothetical protein